MRGISIPSPDPSASQGVNKVVGDAVQATFNFAQLALVLAASLLVALGLGIVFRKVARFIGRRHEMLPTVLAPVRPAFEILLIIVFTWTGLGWLYGEDKGIAGRIYASCNHLFVIALVASITWLVAQLLKGIERGVLRRVQISESARAKRVETQMQIILRIGVAVVWLVGLAIMLLTFPAARAVGASLLASAGLASVVAGLAAQSTLANVFAGLQLAFSDAMRVDDLVVVDGQISAIEEITLTYVVARVWDGRRIILPTTTFTTKPFENWTRRRPDLIGSVEFDLDWRAPIPLLRAEFERLLEKSDLWDGDTGVLVVSDATNSRIQVRALASAQSLPQLTDLKNYLRERLVRWIQTEAPYAIPHHLVEQGTRSEFVISMPEQVEDKSTGSREEGNDLREQTATQVLTVSELKNVLSEQDVKSKASVNNEIEFSQQNDYPERTSLQEKLGNESVALRHIEKQADGHESSMYSGSLKNVQRAAGLSGPAQEVLDERDRRAEQGGVSGDKAEHKCAGKSFD